MGVDGANSLIFFGRQSLLLKKIKSHKKIVFLGRKERVRSLFVNITLYLHFFLLILYVRPFGPRYLKNML